MAAKRDSMGVRVHSGSGVVLVSANGGAVSSLLVGSMPSNHSAIVSRGFSCWVRTSIVN